MTFEYCEYTFNKLSDKSKEKARDNVRCDGNYPYWDWWDDFFETATNIAKCLGFDTGTKLSASGKKVPIFDISFSGFYSQGNSASFSGEYSYNPNAIEQVSECTTCEKIIEIAVELTTMQITQRLRGYKHFQASITQNGRYSHSGSMSSSIDDYGNEDEVGFPDEDRFNELMVVFADWMYKSLEAEYNHLMSDEVIDSYLEEEKFDASGATI